MSETHTQDGKSEECDRQLNNYCENLETAYLSFTKSKTKDNINYYLLNSSMSMGAER